MEKDIGKIKKNDETDIVIRVDDFGGNRGLTIREFVRSERYTGFTRAGVRIRSDKFEEFKSLINAVSPDDLKGGETAQETLTAPPKEKEDSKEEKGKEPASSEDDKPNNSGIDEKGLM